MSDGRQSLLDIVERSGVDFELIRDLGNILMNREALHEDRV
jgi:aminopeptidase-like protein